MVLPENITSNPSRQSTTLASISSNVNSGIRNEPVSVISKNLAAGFCLRCPQVTLVDLRETGMLDPARTNPANGEEMDGDLPPVDNSGAASTDFQEDVGVQEAAGAEAMMEDDKENNSNTMVRQPIGKTDTFKMLQVLLKKSGIYAELILKRMHDEEENQRKKSTKAAKAVATGLPDTRTRRRTRAAANGPDVNFADFFDKKELQAKRSKYFAEEVPDFKTVRRSGAGHSSQPANSADQHPELFTGGVLRPYQFEGLQWLKAQYAQGVSGILADEMGLGKTIQCIALICHLYSNGVTGPFLITAPLSTIPNWLSEFERFAPQVPVVLYHGDYEKRLQLRKEVKQYRRVPCNDKKVLPVVVTSYEMIITDYKFLSGFHWKHLIIDEAQRVKNFRCRLIQKLKLFTVESRLLMTGTPVQNNLAELWALLNFLMPDVFANLEWFEDLFGVETVQWNLLNANAITNLAQKEEENQTLTKLHRILAPFLLRRLKSDVEHELPKKKEILVYAPMTPLQIKYYKAGVDKVIVPLFREDKIGKWEPLPDGVRLRSENRKVPTVKVPRGPVMQNLRCVKASLVLFRKITMHPYLLENPMVPGTTDQFLINENLVLKSGKMLVLDRLLVALKARGHKVLLFSTMTQMLDILMDYCELRSFKFCRLDGRMGLEERQIEIKRFNEDPDYFIFMISTRAGGVGLNLMAADTVIIFDSDWNPQVDLQAQDRCHRIGQTKPVIVYRLVTRGTIDERILERGTAKRRLEKMVVHSGKFKQMSQEEFSKATPMSTTELQLLLQSTDYNECWEPTTMGKNVISDDDLERLLDRTALITNTSNCAPNNGEQGTNEVRDAFRVLA